MNLKQPPMENKKGHKPEENDSQRPAPYRRTPMKNLYNNPRPQSVAN
jgi:hypothetical protein